MLYNRDCLEVMKEFESNSFHSCVTDPPYGIKLMGKTWDHDVPKMRVWQEVYRVLKPGAYLLAFFGTRTYHRGVVAIEDAGFEITDMINWVFASGYPKAHHLDKMIKDEEQKAKWGTWTTGHLKPAHEPIVIAKKPFKGSVAKNLELHEVGGFNIEACRVGNEAREYALTGAQKGETANAKGRFPANLIHDGSDEVIEVLGETASMFYCVKASSEERDEGLEGLPKTVVPWFQTSGGTSGKASSLAANRKTERVNHHPSVKPVALMQYLCRLVTPPSGHVIDPFMGTGTTLKAALREGFDITGIEIDPTYYDHAMRRIEYEHNRLHPGRKSNILQRIKKEETGKE